MARQRSAGTGRARGLGVPALVSIGIGGMVGGGIFSVLGLTAEIAGAGSYLSFVVGGAVAALTGASYARLSVAVRSRGGTASFLDRAFGVGIAGPLNLLMWLSYFVMLSLYASAFGSYAAAVLGLGDGWWPRHLLATAVIVLFTALNLGGAALVAEGEAVLVYFKLAVLVVFCAGALTTVQTDRVVPSAFPGFGTIVYAGALIFLAYEGFELIANAAEDARDPERTLPRAYLVAIGTVIVLYVVVAFAAVGNLTTGQIADERDFVLAAAARPVFGETGFVMIGIAAVVSTASAINATLYGAAKFSYLMARHGELPTGLGRPVWDRPVGGLIATALGTLLIVNTVNIEGISLMGSAGFLIVFTAVNLAALRLRLGGRGARVLAGAGAIACTGSLIALIGYAATEIPSQLGVLGGLLLVSVLGELALRNRRTAVTDS